MINYTWDCRTVDVYPIKGELEKVVYNVHWRLTGTDENGISETIIGTQVLNTDNITDFKPFNELTNDEVVEWTKSSLGSDRVAEIELNIANQIEEKINPKSITLNIQ